MKFKVHFTLNRVKACPIYSGYRPTWISNSKPDHNGAIIHWSGGHALLIGESVDGFIWPFCPELWNKVAINDTLKCMEGSRVVGEAIVLEILPDVPMV